MADPAVYEDYNKLEKVMNNHSQMLDDYERLGGRRHESQVKATLSALGMTEESWDTPTRVLSGGQKKLILLAKLLVLKPQLLLLDVMMPGMDGPSTLTALKKIPEFSNLPAIFMTAKVQPQEIKQLLTYGAIDVIAKPFDPMTLADTIRDIWNKNNCQERC